jgi:hypothetical protein
MNKGMRLLLIAIITLLAGYIILKGCDMYYEYSSGLSKTPRTEQENVPPRNEQQKEEPVRKKIDAPVKEI